MPDPDKQTIIVRRQKLYPGQRRFVKVTVSKIDRAAETLSDVEVDLYKASHDMRQKRDRKEADRLTA